MRMLLSGISPRSLSLPAALLLLAGCGGHPPAPDPRGVDHDETFLTVSATNTLSVRLRDVGKAGEAVAAATAAGANVLSGPSLQIADPEKANKGAYIAAYRAARTRAEAYGEAAGMTISRVLSIRDGGGSAPPMNMVYAEAEMAAPQAVAAPPPVIRPGTSRTRVSVQVDFALKEK